MISDLTRRLLAVRGDCFECNATGVLHELDGQRVHMIPAHRLGDVRRLPCHFCKISEAEWLDLKQRAAMAEKVAAAHSPNGPTPSPSPEEKP